MRRTECAFALELAVFLPLLLVLGGVFPAVGQNNSDWRAQAGPPLTTEQLDALLRMAKLPTGLYLQDSLQAFGNAMNDLNNQNPWMRASNHSGFSVWLSEPKAWLGARKEVAKKRFKTYGASNAAKDDRLPVMRVIVHPDTPEYLNAIGAAHANNADHVVLRSIDRTQVAQPLTIEPTTEEFWNALGARIKFSGLVAIFSMKDLAVC